MHTCCIVSLDLCVQILPVPSAAFSWASKSNKAESGSAEGGWRGESQCISTALSEKSRRFSKQKVDWRSVSRFSTFTTSSRLMQLTQVQRNATLPRIWIVCLANARLSPSCHLQTAIILCQISCIWVNRSFSSSNCWLTAAMSLSHTYSAISLSNAFHKFIEQVSV